MNSEWRGMKEVDVIAFNNGAEGEFVALLSDWQGKSVAFVVDNSAFLLDVSTATTRRYLRKYTCEVAPFKLQGGVVQLRGGKGAAEEAADEGSCAKPPTGAAFLREPPTGEQDSGGQGLAVSEDSARDSASWRLAFRRFVREPLSDYRKRLLRKSKK